jgi:hypothetical protein
MPNPWPIFLSQTPPAPSNPGLLDIASPPPLPEGGWLQVHTLESPWLLAGALVVAGALVLVWFARRDELRKGLSRGGPLVLLAGLLVLLASSVHTQRERMRDSARALIAAVAQADVPAIRASLTEDSRLEYFGGISLPAIIDQVESNMTPGRRWAVKEHAIEAIQMQPAGPDAGLVQLKVRVIPEATNFPHRSWWKLTLQRSPDGTWRTRLLTPLEIQWESGVR